MKRKNFNWQIYINNYEDLRNAGINTQKKAQMHWLKFGMKEGRTFDKITTNNNLSKINNEINNNNEIICNITKYLHQLNNNYNYNNNELIFQINENIEINKKIIIIDNK